MTGKVFVSVDFEGLPYIVSPLHLAPDRSLFGEARRVATRLVASVAKKLLELGYERVVVADSHGFMLNIEPDKLPRGVTLVRGFPRTLNMVTGAQGARFAVLLGYHARAGVDSVLSHTFSSALHRVVVNGVEASEYLLCSAVLGEWGVPVGLVAGSRELVEEVASHTPWAVAVPLKTSLGFVSAESPSIEEVEEELSKSLEEVHRRAEEGRLKPLRIPPPVEVVLEFSSPLYAEVASLVPGAKRVDGRSVVFQLESVERVARLLDLVILAVMGARYSGQVRS